MKAHRVWIEIVLLGAGIALALALLLASLGTAAGVAEGQVAQPHALPGSQAFDGMITCSHCGAKHQAALNQSASTCVRTCVHGGAGFALIDNDSIYLLDGDLLSLKQLAGRRAHIVGTRTGNTIKVLSATSES